MKVPAGPLCTASYICLRTLKFCELQFSFVVLGGMVFFEVRMFELSNMLISLPMYFDKHVLSSSVNNVPHFSSGCLKFHAVAAVFFEKSSLGKKGLRSQSITTGKSHHIHSQVLGEKENDDMPPAHLAFPTLITLWGPKSSDGVAPFQALPSRIKATETFLTEHPDDCSLTESHPVPGNATLCQVDN